MQNMPKRSLFMAKYEKQLTDMRVFVRIRANRKAVGCPY